MRENDILYPLTLLSDGESGWRSTWMKLKSMPCGFLRIVPSVMSHCQGCKCFPYVLNSELQNLKFCVVN